MGRRAWRAFGTAARAGSAAVLHAAVPNGQQKLLSQQIDSHTPTIPALCSGLAGAKVEEKFKKKKMRRKKVKGNNK
jgi:hypothetical protein